jgi:uncharacterized membrane protein YhaH (DUF805 family)
MADRRRPGLTEPERAELERLRREVAELRESAGISGSAPSRGVGRTRLQLVTAVTLVILASLVAPLAVGARYVHDQLLDTDRYVALVAPLAEEPEVREVITEQLTVQIFTVTAGAVVVVVLLELLGHRSPAAASYNGSPTDRSPTDRGT